MTAYDAFAGAVLGLYCAPIRRPATRRKLAQVLAEFAGLVETTDELTPAAVAAWLAAHPGRSARTSYSLLRTFRSAIRAGMALGLVGRDPFAFRAPRAWFPAGALEADRPRKHHAAASIRRVLDLADAEAAAPGAPGARWRAGRLRTLTWTAAYTGARRNEILGLRIEDVDPVAGVVRIRPNDARPLKTARSAAELPLAAPAAERIRRWIPQAGSEWLFPQWRARGPWLSGLHGYRAGDQLVALGERAGVEGLTFQSLRHSFATLAESWGLGELMVQRILRHSRPQTQLHYRHHDLDLMRDAVGRVRF